MVISNHRCCAGCLEKQIKIDRLEIEIQRLRAKLRYQERTAKEGPFGSSTPSSKIPIKPSSLEERQARRGGGKVGHTGHGRLVVTVADADHVERIEADTTCPACGTHLEDRGLRRRTVIDCEPVQGFRERFWNWKRSNVLAAASGSRLALREFSPSSCMAINC